MVAAESGYLESVRRFVFDGLDATQAEHLADLGEAMSAQLAVGLRQSDDHVD